MRLCVIPLLLLALTGCAQILGIEDPQPGTAADDAEEDPVVTPPQLAGAAGTVTGGGYRLTVQVGAATVTR